MKIFKIILSLVIVFCVSTSIHSQRSSKIKNAKLDTFSLPEPHLLRLGITPTSFINEYIGVQGNGAVNLSERFQFNLEFGWIFFSTINIHSDINGFRLRPAFRFYLKKTRKYQLHLSAGYNYRKTLSQRSAKFNFIGGPSPIVYDFEQSRKLRGISYLIGLDFFVKDNFIIDIGIGTGLGNLTVEDRGTPEGGSRFFLGSPFNKRDFPQDYQFAMFIVNFKVQYLIR